MPKDEFLGGSASGEKKSALQSGYRLHVVFKQSERRAIAKKLVQMFDALAKQERQDMEKKQKEIDDARIAFEAHLNGLIAEMNKAWAAYELKKVEKEAEYRRESEEDKRKVAETQAKVDRLSKELNDKVTEAQKKLKDDERKRDADIAAEEAKLRSTESEWEGRIQQKHRDLEAAKKRLTDRFGDAE